MTKVNGIPVDPLINVEVHMYFEVHNSDLWGGKGSVGYMEVGYCECKNIIINELNSDFIDRQIEFAANSACVDKSMFDLSPSRNMMRNQMIKTIKGENRYYGTVF